CIPSKHLAVFAAAKSSAERFASAGMPALAGGRDLGAFQIRRSAAIDGLVKGVAGLLAAAGVNVVQGNAWFVGRTRVCVATGEESVRYLDFKDVVIATGSCAVPMPGLPFDAERVVEPSRALEWTSGPRTLLVAGDDYVSLELGVAFARLGSRVVIATRGDRLLPDFDADISQAAERGAGAAGVEVVIGRFPLAALGRAVIESSTSGFAKLVFARESGVIVAAHLAGPRATELIAEMALAIEMGATSEDLALTMHAHPTFAES